MICLFNIESQRIELFRVRSNLEIWVAGHCNHIYSHIVLIYFLGTWPCLWESITHVRRQNDFGPVIWNHFATDAIICKNGVEHLVSELHVYLFLLYSVYKVCGIMMMNAKSSRKTKDESWDRPVAVWPHVIVDAFLDFDPAGGPWGA